MATITVNAGIIRLGKAKECATAFKALASACEQDPSFDLTVYKAMGYDVSAIRPTDKAAVEKLTVAAACIDDYIQVLQEALERTPLEWPPYSESAMSAEQDT